MQAEKCQTKKYQQARSERGRRGLQLLAHGALVDGFDGRNRNYFDVTLTAIQCHQFFRQGRTEDVTDGLLLGPSLVGLRQVRLRPPLQGQGFDGLQ